VPVSDAMKTIAKIPLRLWVEFTLYTLTAIAIQILCHLLK
jgi:hypothetical protein